MRRLASLLCLAALLATAGCYDDVKVVQGVVTATNDDAKTITIRDERAPGAVLVYQLPGRAATAVGDVVRLAYRVRGEERIAVRMMNVTRARKARGGEKH
jgi:hypothetical protein